MPASRLFTDSSESKLNSAIKIHLISTGKLNDYVSSTSKFEKTLIEGSNFTAAKDSLLVIPTKNGEVDKVLAGVGENLSFWSVAFLPKQLNYDYIYSIDAKYSNNADKISLADLSLGWALACYQFDKFKTEKIDKTTRYNKKTPKLFLSDDVDRYALEQMVISTYFVRDLINMPTNHLQAEQLADAAIEIADEFSAKYDVIVGDDLLKANYPAIHAVGRASDSAPRLVDIKWGEAKNPLVTLVGKGVCFDTGGLDIKSSAGMSLMKKDMGGAAHVLGLARLIMAHNLPVQLRVLVPAVENSISANAFRTQDVLNTRSGITVEVGNTDAEGRLILCDALSEAVSGKPDLIIDCATLTGAARVALGADVPAFFTPSDELAGELSAASATTKDRLWRLPLVAEYKASLKSNVADINNISSEGYGGAITAALFLEHFVANTHWIHVDMMAWNKSSRNGRPTGGEAMGLRALFELIRTKYK